MKKQDFYNFINQENIPFVESNFYLNTPGLYGIIVYSERFVAYKNIPYNIINHSPTEWAKECPNIEDAYHSIYEYISQNNKKYLKK